MMEKERTYIAIDLKSFYASVECKERNRDPLTTNLVVADKSRTEKTNLSCGIASIKVLWEYQEGLVYLSCQKVKEATAPQVESAEQNFYRSL